MKIVCNDYGCMAMAGDVPVFVYVLIGVFVVAWICSKLFGGDE